MTILSVCQSAALVIGIEEPDVVIGSTDRTVKELANAAKETARAIAEAHDWQALMTLATFTGDGSTEDFALPSDYRRMPKDAMIWSSRLDGPLYHVTSADKWRELEVRAYEFVRGVWILLGDEISIKPAMASAETATFYYQTKSVWADGATYAEDPASDAYTLRIDERLLKLGTVWQWKQWKGLPYAEEMESYERALGDAIQRDKGSRVMRAGRGRIPSAVSLAYPQAITP